MSSTSMQLSQNEAEMKEQLIEANLYEENMSLEDMQSIVQVLQISKQDSFKIVQNSPTHSPEKSTSSYSEEFERTANKYEISGHIQHKPLPSLTVKCKVPLQEHERAIFSQDTITDDHSSIFDDITDDKNINNGTSNENESKKNVEYNIENNNDFPAIDKKLIPKDAVTPKQKTKKTVAELKKQNLERWRLDLFSCERINQLPEHSFHDSEDMWPKFDLDDDEAFDKLCSEIGEKLDILEKRCIPEEYYSELAPPIKIETSGYKPPTTRKKPFEKLLDNFNQCSDNSKKEERATKRKATNSITGAVYDFDSDEPTVDDDSGDEFIPNNIKKKRKTLQDKTNEPTKKSRDRDKLSTTNHQAIETIDVDKDLSGTEVYDNSHNTLRKRNTNDQKIENIDEPSAEFPRRIIPPNPSKKSFKGPRASNKNKPSAGSSLNEALSDTEIKKILHEIDDCVEVPKDTTAKSFPKNSTLNRMQAGKDILMNKVTAEEENKRAEEEALKEKAMKANAEKEERIRKRQQQQELEELKIMEKNQRTETKEELYRTLRNSTNKRVTRANFNNKFQENNFESIDTLKITIDNEGSQSKLKYTESRCPICQKIFLNKEIEEHAAGCNAFQTDESDHELLKCRFCFEFQTHDQNEYQRHIPSCSEQAGNPSTSRSSSILTCQYCHAFSSAEADQFEKHRNVCPERVYKNRKFNDESYTCMYCDKFSTRDGHIYEEHTSKCESRPYERDEKRNGIYS
ncbi:uncharacterized protein LOC106656272 isoform X1 [Trichogramma pretiosum]|uniref:uncharacterized protein LOC106656272 isoform X1 n=1 Tax=Trichogramma pretiosum TaxID=7493 RepID=UPI0006C9A886|nr:uncharacterized protein LOC106656272 isoform X1 [Trichogramma pretiosum]